MGFDFFPTTAHPAAPIVGDVSNGYTWDGEKWTMIASGTNAPASSANPKPLGPVAPGVATPYSREDHVHPIDATVRYDSAQALTAAQQTQAQTNIGVRPKLTYAINYYVSPTGNDANDGLATATAKLTIQGAYNAILNWDLNGFPATINVANGTYAQAVSTAAQPY